MRVQGKAAARGGAGRGGAGLRVGRLDQAAGPRTGRARPSSRPTGAPTASDRSSSIPGMMGAFTDLAVERLARLRGAPVPGAQPRGRHGGRGRRASRTTTRSSPTATSSSFGAPPGDHVIELDFSGGLWRGEENRPYRGAAKGPIDIGKISRLAFVNRGTSVPFDRSHRDRACRAHRDAGRVCFRFRPFRRAGHGADPRRRRDDVLYCRARIWILGTPPLATIRPMSYPTPLLGDAASASKQAAFGGSARRRLYGWIAFERGGFWEARGRGLQPRGAPGERRRGARARLVPAFCALLFEDTELTDIGQVVDRMVWPSHQVSRFRFEARKGTNHFTLDVTDPNHLPLRVAGLILAPDTAEGRAFVDAHERRQREAVARAFAPRDRGRREGRSAPARAIVIEPLRGGRAGVSAGLALAARGRAGARDRRDPRPDRCGAARCSYPAGGEGPRGCGAAHGARRRCAGRTAGAPWALSADASARRWHGVAGGEPLPAGARFRRGAGLARSVVLELPIPENARPGVYSGQVRFTAGEASVEVPLVMRVFAVRLPVIPAPVGLLMNALPFGPEVVGEERWWAMQEALLQEQGRAGLTCVTGGAGLEYSVERREGVCPSAASGRCGISGLRANMGSGRRWCLMAGSSHR